MSGVFAHVGAPGGAVNREIVARMAAAVCRQPWHVAETASPDPAVAAGRQGVGAFNPSPQPVSDPAGAVSLWLSGEFYHQQDLRASLVAAGRLAPAADDAALALAVYERDGATGLTRLDGAFLAAVWDGRTREFVLVNDRFGLYPHLYAHAGGGLTFAPDLDAILCNPAVPRTVDRTTLAQFVRFQQALGDRTWFEDVHLLPPASQLRYRPADDRLLLEAYWDWSRMPTQPSIGFDDAVDAGLHLFQRAVDARLEPPLRSGVFLSGGLDGRAIVGFTPGDVPLTTITYGQEGCWDVVIGARLARTAGRPHHWLPFADGTWVSEFAPLHVAITSGLHGWTNAHGISVMGDVRGLIDVNLSGFDGGTIFGGRLDGYHDRPYRDATTEAELLRNFFEGMTRRFNWPGLVESEAQALVDVPGGRDLLPLAVDSLRTELRSITELPPGRRGDFFYNNQVQRRVLLDQLVVQRSAVDVRCPFFDYAFVDFMYSLPDPIRTTPAYRNAVLTRRMPKLVRVPYEKDGRLPHSNPWVSRPHALVQRVKGRINRHLFRLFPERPWVYADYENYLRTDLRAWAEDLLAGPRAVARGLFDPAVVRSLWARHLAGDEAWILGKIAPLITIELAFRHFVDGEPDGLHAAAR